MFATLIGLKELILHFQVEHYNPELDLGELNLSEGTSDSWTKKLEKVPEKERV